LGVASESLQNAAAVVGRIGRMGIDLQRFGNQPLPFLELSGLGVQGAEQVERVEVLRVDAQDVATKPDRLGSVSDLMRPLCALDRRVVVHGGPASTAKC